MNALSNSDLDYFFEHNFEEIKIYLKIRIIIFDKKRDHELNIGGTYIDMHINNYMKRLSSHRHRPEMLNMERMEKEDEFRKILESMEQSVGEVCYIQE